MVDRIWKGWAIVEPKPQDGKDGQHMQKYGVAGGKVIKKDTFVYRVPLITAKETKVIIYATSFDVVTQQIGKLDMSEATGLFNMHKEGVDRPSGEI